MVKRTQKPPTIEDKIKGIKDIIVKNHPSDSDIEGQLAELLRLQKAKCEMNKEIDINISDVIKEYPIGEAVVVKRIKQGWLFECRNGFMTFVPHNVVSVANLFSNMEILIENSPNDELTVQYRDAIPIIFQAPIFSSISPEAFWDNARNILHNFNQFVKNNYEDAKESPQPTEEDYKENAEQENITQALENLE